MAKEELNLKDIWLAKIMNEQDRLYTYKTIKSIPSEWVEDNIVLTKEVSRFSGNFEYELSPYAREMIDCLHPSSPYKIIAVMKGAQSGITQGVIVPGMAWIISEHPDNFLFTASDKDIAKMTITQRFDPLMRSSGLKDLIRPNVVRAKGQRSGDTDFSKEFAGGSAIIEGTNNAGKFRFFSVKTVFMDDFDNAPKADKKEGSIRKLVEGRQTSYGNLAKTFYVSTPTATQTSNIYEMYLQGDQRKWHWPCPCCGTFVASDWTSKMEDGTKAGIIYDLDKNRELIEESVKFRFNCCGHEISNNEKHDINVAGDWIATVKPKDKYYRSYYMNSLIIPPGFITWLDLVKEWLEACPPGGRVRVDLLKVFNNVRLGLPFKEEGSTPRMMQLMENIRDYDVAVIPDKTCVEDGNGSIVLITLAADLGGEMLPGKEDVRIDWEILAHSSEGATYSIDQGSIGTFKRANMKRKIDKENESKRERLTYAHGMNNSAWPELEKVVKQKLKSESGKDYAIKLTLIDTGHFTKHAYQFIKDTHSSRNWCFGIKGVPEQVFRRDSKDVKRIRKSSNISNLYLLDVEQLKDDLAENMKLKFTDNGTQESGFMNFPKASDGKYKLKEYFKHFESESRQEVRAKGEVIGFKWEKKHSDVENHFWDVRIYNNAAKYVFIDLVTRMNPTKYKGLTWDLLVKVLLKQ